MSAARESETQEIIQHLFDVFLPLAKNEGVDIEKIDVESLTDFYRKNACENTWASIFSGGIQLKSGIFQSEEFELAMFQQFQQLPKGDRTSKLLQERKESLNVKQEFVSGK